MCAHTRRPGTRGAAAGHPEVSPSIPGAGRLPKEEPRARPLPRRDAHPAGAGGARRGSPAAAGTAAQPARKRRGIDAYIYIHRFIRSTHPPIYRIYRRRHVTRPGPAERRGAARSGARGPAASPAPPRPGRCFVCVCVGRWGFSVTSGGENAGNGLSRSPGKRTRAGGRLQPGAGACGRPGSGRGSGHPARRDLPVVQSVRCRGTPTPPRPFL